MFEEILIVVKYLAILLGIGVFVFVVVMIIRNIKHLIRKYRLDDEGVSRKVISGRWAEIEKLLETEGEMSDKLAVMEADKLLDYTLKSMAMPGQTMGERLKFACYKYDRLKKVWWAHKVRNKLAHESSFHLDRGIAKKAVREFKSALEELGAL